MAQRTISSGSYIRPYRSRYGSAPVKGFQASTGPAFKVGEVVTFEVNTATNAHKIYLSSVTAAVQKFIGFAAEAKTDTNGVGTKLAVWVADPLVEFQGVSKSTAGNGLQSSNIGTKYSLSLDSTLSIWYVNLDESSAGKVSVIVTDAIDDFGDTNAMVAFRVMSTACQLQA